MAPEVNWCAEFYVHTPPHAGSCLCFKSASGSPRTPLPRPLYEPFILPPAGKPSPRGGRQVESSDQNDLAEIGAIARFSKMSPLGDWRAHRGFNVLNKKKEREWGLI